jgi:hypothetical protein
LKERYEKPKREDGKGSVKNMWKTKEMQKRM